MSRFSTAYLFQGPLSATATATLELSSAISRGDLKIRIAEQQSAPFALEVRYNVKDGELTASLAELSFSPAAANTLLKAGALDSAQKAIIQTSAALDGELAKEWLRTLSTAYGAHELIQGRVATAEIGLWNQTRTRLRWMQALESRSSTQNLETQSSAQDLDTQDSAQNHAPAHALEIAREIWPVLARAHRDDDLAAMVRALGLKAYARISVLNSAELESKVNVEDSALEREILLQTDGLKAVFAQLGEKAALVLALRDHQAQAVQTPSTRESNASEKKQAQPLETERKRLLEKARAQYNATYTRLARHLGVDSLIVRP